MKFLLSILMTICFAYLCLGQEQKLEVKDSTSVSSQSDSISYDNSKIQNYDWQRLVEFASLYIGTPYHYGGTSILGFDCSGFISYIFNYFGIKLPHSSSNIAQLGITVAKDQLQTGDLVFFSGRRSGGIGHVGMIIEASGEAIKMIHASVSKGVTIDDINVSDYWRSRYITAKRLLMSQSESSNP